MKQVITILVGLATFLLVGAQILNSEKTSNFKDGDIIFQSSSSNQSLAIQIATNSKYSHVGIIFFKDNKPYVLEAVEPVKITSLSNFIAHGEDGKYVVKRKKGKALSAKEISDMKKIGDQWIGKHYDFYFSWTDEKLYCSELVYKLYQRAANLNLGTPKPLKSYNISHPVVLHKLSERYGDSIPYAEKMISPEEIFASPHLYTVFSN